jgi:hypothetical protein
VKVGAEAVSRFRRALCCALKTALRFAPIRKPVSTQFPSWILEAAIGIEPMNKGFAVLPAHFQGVQLRLLKS